MARNAHREAALASGLLAFTLGAVTLACFGDNDDAVAPGGGVEVHVRGTAGYSTDSVTISVGQSVTWIWDEAGHTVTSSDMAGGIPGCTPNGMFDSGAKAAGETFTQTFNAPGTYAYFCSRATDCTAFFESAVVVVN